MAETMTGGYQCGQVSYVAEGDDLDAHPCQCTIGGVAAAFKNVSVSGLRWSDDPDHYRSSPIARRRFCGRCGTPLTDEGDGRDRLDLTVGGFAQTGRLGPVSHAGVESRHAAWLDTTGLPSERTQDNVGVRAAWEAVGAKFPA